MARLLPLLLLVTLSACASTQARPDTYGPREPVIASREQPSARAAQPRTLEQMLEQEDFDLPRALLLFSREYGPEVNAGDGRLDVEGWLARFDEYAANLRQSLKRHRTPRQRLRTLIDFVHVKLGLSFDRDDPAGHRPDNLFLDRVLDRRRGYCVTLSLAYVVFGQAAGVNVHGVRIPGHFAVRFAEGEGADRFETLVESTASGSLLDDNEVWVKHRFSFQAYEDGVYLKPLSDRAIFSTLFNNLAGLSHLAGRNDRAIALYGRALELAPNNIEALYNRALIQRRQGKTQSALRDLNAALARDPNFTLALIARAGLFWDAGEKALAREDLSLALRQRRDWPEPHMLDGVFEAAEGRLENAKAAFERALKADPGFLDAHRALAEVERKLGNEKAAREHETLAGGQ